MEKGRSILGIYDVQLELPKRRIVVPKQIREAFTSDISFRLSGGLIQQVPILLLQYGPIATPPALELPREYKTRDNSLEHVVKTERILIPQDAASFLGTEKLSFIGCIDYLLLARTQDTKMLTDSPGDNVDLARALWVK